MVRRAGRLFSDFARGVRDDIGRLSAQVQASTSRDDIISGLYTYRIREPGHSLTIHLRIEPDRTGLLFINATETIYLSPTEAEMAKLALDEVPVQQALGHLRAYYHHIPARRLKDDFRRICDLVDKLKAPIAGCRVCQLGLDQPAPFSIRSQAPYKADLALHYACNNACSHCYNEPGRKTMPSLPLAGWRRVLTKLYDIGVPYIIFTGGEPTLYPALVDLVSYAENLGQITGLNTNGRRLARAGFAAELLKAGLDHVQVTINSHRRDLHNRIVGAEAFDETVSGIQTCLETGLHTLTNTTLITDNADEALDIVDFLHALGIRTFAMNGMIYSGCGARHPAALTDNQVAPVLRKVQQRAEHHDMRFLWYTPTRYCHMSPLDLGLGIHFCNAAEYSVCVEPNGDVLPCQSYYESAGNMLTDPWQRIWDSQLFRSFRFRREQPEQANLPEECRDCEMLDTCAGGCPLERREHDAPTSYAVTS